MVYMTNTATLARPVNKFAEIRTLAELHLEDHGLHDWTLAWDDAVRRKGQCRYVEQEIGLSRWYVEGATEDEVEQTILHEIAHALTPGAGHGPVWKAKARAIGVRDPRSASASTAPRPKGKYSGTCARCGSDEFQKVRMTRNRDGSLPLYTHRACGGTVTYRQNW